MGLGMCMCPHDPPGSSSVGTESGKEAPSGEHEMRNRPKGLVQRKGWGWPRAALSLRSQRPTRRQS